MLNLDLNYVARLRATVSNVTLFLRSALGVDASLLSNVSLTATGTAGTVSDAMMLLVMLHLLICDVYLFMMLQMSVEFVVSADARMSTLLLVSPLITNADAGNQSSHPGGVSIQSTPIVQRILGVTWSLNAFSLV